jgi:hypothetical protein
MRNLDSSKWLTRSDLIKTEVRGTDKRNRYEFGLNVKLRPPENAENLDAQPSGDERKGPDAAEPATPLHGAPTPAIAMPAETGTPPPPAKPPADKGGDKP